MYNKRNTETAGVSYPCDLSSNAIYYIKLQLSLSVCLYPPPFSTRTLERNQIWHTYSDRYGTGSHQKQIDLPHPRGNITSYVTSSNIERRTFETFKNYRSTFDDVTDDVILRNFGGMLGDVI